MPIRTKALSPNPQVPKQKKKSLRLFGKDESDIEYRQRLRAYLNQATKYITKNEAESEAFRNSLLQNLNADNYAKLVQEFSQEKLEPPIDFFTNYLISKLEISDFSLMHLGMDSLKDIVEIYLLQKLSDGKKRHESLTTENFLKLIQVIPPNKMFEFCKSFYFKLPLTQDGVQKNRLQAMTTQEFLALIELFLKEISFAKNKFIINKDRFNLCKLYLDCKMLPDGQMRKTSMSAQDFLQLISKLDKIESKEELCMHYLTKEVFLSGRSGKEYREIAAKDFLQIIESVPLRQTANTLFPSNYVLFCNNYLRAKPQILNTLTFKETLDLVRNANISTQKTVFESYLNAKFDDERKRSQTLSPLEYSYLLDNSERPKDLFEICKKAGCPFGIKEIASAYISIENENQDIQQKQSFLKHLLASELINEDQLVDILRSSFSNDTILADFVSDFSPSRSDEKNKSFFAKLIKTIRTDAEVLYLVEQLMARRIINEEKYILDLLKEKKQETCSQIYKALEGLQLKDLPPESLRSLKDLFGTNFNESDYKMSNILNYYICAGGGIRNFVDLLGNDLKARIKASYKVPDDVLCFFDSNRKEYDNLCAMVGNLNFPDFSGFCGYLSQKKRVIPDGILQNPTINFEGIKYIKGEGDFEDKKEALRKKFKEIISRPRNSISQGEVLEFLSYFFDPKDWETISDINKNKIYDIFVLDPKNTAFLFQTKGALAQFIPEVTDVSAACVKNLGTKFEAILAKHSMSDPASSALYNFYLSEVFTVLAQLPTNCVGDVMHGGDSTGDAVCNNEIINSQKLNPVALVKQFEKYLTQNAEEFNAIKNSLILPRLDPKIQSSLRELPEAEMIERINMILGDFVEDSLEGDYDLLNNLIIFCAMEDFLTKSHLKNFSGIKEHCEKMSGLKAEMEEMLGKIKPKSQGNASAPSGSPLTNGNSKTPRVKVLFELQGSRETSA